LEAEGSLPNTWLRVVLAGLEVLGSLAVAPALPRWVGSAVQPYRRQSTRPRPGA